MATRVLRLIARLNVGGPAQHVVWLSPELAGRGYSTLLATGRVGPDEDEHAAILARWGVVPHRVRCLGRAIRPLADLVAFAAVLDAMFRFRPDIVHTHTAKAGFVGRAAAIVYGLLSGRRPLIVHTFHGHVFSGYFGPAKTAVFLALERAVARETDALLVLSPRQRRELVDRYRIAPDDRFREVPLGIDLAPFLAAGDGRRDDGRPGPARVGWVGRLAPIKDPLLLCDIARRLPEVRFVVAGDGVLGPETRAAAGANVELAGTLLDLPPVYADLDLLVLTSRNEGTPVAILEAFAAGVPVVAPAVGGVPDLLAEGRGVLFEPGDAAGAARAIADLLADRPAARAMAERARAYVRTTHSLAALGDRIDAVYRELAGRS